MSRLGKIKSICEWIYRADGATKMIMVVSQGELCENDVAYMAQLIESDGTNEKEVVRLGAFDNLTDMIKIAKNEYPPTTAIGV